MITDYIEKVKVSEAKRRPCIAAGLANRWPVRDEVANEGHQGDGC